jgi:hypothetical protein
MNSQDHDPGRELDGVIKPEEEDGNNWTKVSIDTFVL